jgi:hypothetical protein
MTTHWPLGCDAADPRRIATCRAATFRAATFRAATSRAATFRAATLGHVVMLAPEGNEFCVA